MIESWADIDSAIDQHDPPLVADRGEPVPVEGPSTRRAIISTVTVVAPRRRVDQIIC